MLATPTLIDYITASWPSQRLSLGVVTVLQLRQLLQHTLVPQDEVMITELVVDTVYGLSGGNPYW